VFERCFHVTIRKLARELARAQLLRTARSDVEKVIMMTDLGDHVADPSDHDHPIRAIAIRRLLFKRISRIASPSRGARHPR
jgi:hypothetical protein